MKTEIVKISAFNSTDWDGAIYALSQALIPIIILAIILLRRRKKQKKRKPTPLECPDKEEILRKAKLNAKNYKVDE